MDQHICPVLALTRCGLSNVQNRARMTTILLATPHFGAIFTPKVQNQQYLVHFLHQNNLAKRHHMTKKSQSKEISSRLRSRIEKRFPSRGRYRELEEVSGISASRWKNFFYGRTEAALEMVDFWCNKYPSERDYLIHGVHQNMESPPLTEGLNMLDKKDGRTIAERLSWVISQWASPSGEQLFSYLEERSNGMISADAWKEVITHNKSPSAEMIALVGEFRPHFIEWIVSGRTSNDGQVNPTDKHSVENWQRRVQSNWEMTFNQWDLAQIQPTPKN